MTEFQGNEPQTGVSVPPEMLDAKGDKAYGLKEPAIGCVVQFSTQNDRDYAAIRTSDGWFIAGVRGRHTWSDMLALTKGPVFVMTPLAALHP